MKKFIALALSLLPMCLMAQTLSLSSPNGKHCVSFHQVKVETGYELRYSVSYDGKEVILDSRAGLNMDNRIWEMALGKRDLVQYSDWMNALEADSVSYNNKDEWWTPLYGERNRVHDAYNGGTLYLSRKDKSGYRLNIEVRAYDEGVAFRYFFPEHQDAIFHKVVEDETEYTFPEGTKAWSEQWAQSFFEHKDVNDLQYPVERALTLDLPNGLWSAIVDADVDDWCLTKLQSKENKRNTLKSVMYSPVDIVTYYATPWKIVMVANTPGELLENNFIIENLNPPCEIADAEKWVKPGKIMREITLTNEGAHKVIDFCAEHNMQYLLFDWKWYMPCASHDGDATIVVDNLDMKEIVAYGKSKGIGIWLYVNQHALMKQARELFPLLHEWGIVGVKSGFVQYASHRWATWVHDLVRLAAENHLLMNIHDEFRPSGFSRTYPNLLNQEGICGNEEFPDATHNVTLPFTRMINGAGDYTICYYDKRLKTTHGHQLAASVVYYAPLNTLFWYDKPQQYNGEPEISWFEELKTVWDESRVLSGMPGEHIVMARRNGTTWFLGAMTNNDARTVDIDLSFLEKGHTYNIYTYEDDSTVNTATHIKCEVRRIKIGKKEPKPLRFNLVPSGGAAIRIELSE